MTLDQIFDFVSLNTEACRCAANARLLNLETCRCAANNLSSFFKTNKQTGQSIKGTNRAFLFLKLQQSHLFLLKSQRKQKMQASQFVHFASRSKITVQSLHRKETVEAAEHLAGIQNETQIQNETKNGKQNENQPDRLRSLRSLCLVCDVLWRVLLLGVTAYLTYLHFGLKNQKTMMKYGLDESWMEYRTRVEIAFQLIIYTCCGICIHLFA